MTRPRQNRHNQPWTVHDSLGVALFVLALVVLAWGQWGAVPGLWEGKP